jgi:tetratricopeptide (TPR) repeat protein
VSAAAGWWQTGPGGILGNLVASALWKLGAKGLAALFAKPIDCEATERLLDANGLHVPAKTVAGWLANTETLELLAKVTPAEHGAETTAADDVVLNDAALSFRAAAGNTRSWTETQAREALRLVLGRMLASDVELHHHLSQLRTEGKLDTWFIRVLDDIALVADEVFRTGAAVDEILHHVSGTALGRQIPGYNVPVTNETLFVDRDGLLDRLHQAAGSTTALTAVAGMGGVGKSTVAKVYAQRYRHNFDMVRWFGAGAPDGHDIHLTPPGLLNDLGDLGDELGVIDRAVDDVENRARKTVNVLNSSSLRWLLIFDNAEHPDAIHNWLPTPPAGSQIILTTRSTRFDQLATEVSVTTFTTETGAQFLLDRIRSKNPSAASEDQLADAVALADYLGGLPLALEQAGAYIARRSAERCGTFLRRVRLDLPGAFPTATRPAGYPEPAHLTYLCSISAANDENPHAADVLLTLLYANPDSTIPSALLNTTEIVAPDDLADAIETLTGFSLLTGDDHGLRIHRLVQQACQLAASTPDRTVAHTLFVDMLLTVYRHAREPAARNICNELLPHALHTSELVDASTSVRWELANGAALAVQYAGDPLGAVPRFQAALTITDLLGDDHPLTIFARSGLASSYWSAGRIPEAIALEEKILTDCERILGDEHPDTVTARSNLANSYWSAGRIPEAIALEEKIATDRERILGDEHPDTLTARANLANSYRSAGRIPEAIALLEKVTTDRERILGDEHPYTLIARANLASSYWSAGRIPEAIALITAAIASARSRNDFRHPDLESWKSARAQWESKRL